MLNKTENYKSFQNLELKPFALISLSNVDGAPFKYHNKIDNVIIPTGPELKKLSPSSNKLLLTFEDSTIPKRTKITKTSFNFLTVFKKLSIIIPCFVLLYRNGFE